MTASTSLHPSILPRVSVFPILPEGHLLYKVSEALSLPAKERLGSPLIGQHAPEIILKDQLDRECSLHATIALGRPIVLYFFPLSGSPHCTLQGCFFRDALLESATFTDQDAIVIGVSQDSPALIKKFVTKHDLNFIILSDEKRQAFDTFGVTTRLFGLLNSRCTFIIDPSGTIRGMCEGVLAAQGHMDFATRWLRRIEDEMWHRPKEFASQAMASSLSEGSAPVSLSKGPQRGLVRHGSEMTADVGKAPRHKGEHTEPSNAKRVHSSSSGSSGSGDGNHGDVRDRASRQRTEGSQGHRDSSDTITSTSPLKPTGGKLSLRRALLQKMGGIAPLPPTYKNFDSGVTDFGEVEDVPLGAEKQVARDVQRKGSWDGPVNQTSNIDRQVRVGRQKTVSVPASPTRPGSIQIGAPNRVESSASNHPNGSARKHAGAVEEQDDDTFVPIPSPTLLTPDKRAASPPPSKSSASRIPGVIRGGVLPPIASSISRSLSHSDRSKSAISPSTLEDVDEDRETQAIVRSITDGTVNITPKAQLQPLPPVLPSGMPPVSYASFAGPAPRPPKRTTSRIQSPSLNGLAGSRPTSKSSSDGGGADSTRGHFNRFASPVPTSYDTMSRDSGAFGFALAPRPPVVRTAPVRCQPQEFSKRHPVHSGGEGENGENEDDNDEDEDVKEGSGGAHEDFQSNGAHVQTAKRLTLHTQPVSSLKSTDFATVRKSHSFTKRATQKGASEDATTSPLSSTPTSPHHQSTQSASRLKAAAQGSPSVSTGESNNTKSDSTGGSNSDPSLVSPLTIPEVEEDGEDTRPDVERLRQVDGAPLEPRFNDEDSDYGAGVGRAEEMTRRGSEWSSTSQQSTSMYHGVGGGGSENGITASGGSDRRPSEISVESSMSGESAGTFGNAS